MVLHKTSQYEPEEVAGFRASALSLSSACDLVAITPTGLRLLRRGTIEPQRGTLCTIEDSEYYFFTTGFVPWWKEYPGPHIPAPLQLSFVNPTDVVERAREILLLTKMNWNSADGIGRFPITLTFAKRVGTIMTELAEVPNPNPLYRFYM